MSENETSLNQEISPEPAQPEKPAWRRLTTVVGVGLVIAIGLIAIGAAWFYQLLEGPVSKRPFETTVIIKRGASYHAIAAQLRAAGLLPHPFVLDYLAWRRGDAGHLKPGRYHLHSSLSVRQIYDLLTHGAPIRVTVPEGWTVRQIAARLADEGLLATADEFTSAACDPVFLARHRFTGGSAEGFLLPETYLFDPGTTAGEVLEKMTAEFGRAYAVAAARARPDPLSLTWHQIVTLASMIERETANDAEKPVIASVYYNRLRRDMTLNCDATICYGLDKWNEPLTWADLKKDSPYNTYLRKGLPPGPIACVGRTSLDAALSPAATDYLYYCQKDEHSHIFSRTLAEHSAAVKKYLRKDLTGGWGKK